MAVPVDELKIMSMPDWYYLRGAERRGPLALDEMRTLAKAGEIDGATLVWTVGFNDWRPAAEVPDLVAPRPASTPTQPPPPQDTVRRVSGVVSDLTGTAQIDGAHVSGLFSEVLKRHDEAALERVFSSGLAATTPSIDSIDVAPPTPWVYSRLLLFFGIAFLVLFMAWTELEGSGRLAPGLILVGSFAAPLAAAVFVYECNIPRNISLFVFARLFVWGGVLALLLSLALFPFFSAMRSILGPSIAGLVEEPGKLAAVVILVNATRYHWTLNGMCLGAAVGAGFAAFESAGYALESLLSEGEAGLVHSLALRGVMAPFAHVVWTAICAGALWRVRRGRRFDWEMLKDRRCLSPIVAAMLLHATWNSPLPAMLPLYSGYLLLGGIAWIIAIGMMQEAIGEVKTAKERSVESAA